MDTIKTRLQIEGPNGRFAGPMDCFRKTIKNEGFLGLYKGMTLILYRISLQRSKDNQISNHTVVFL